MIPTHSVCFFCLLVACARVFVQAVSYVLGGKLPVSEDVATQLAGRGVRVIIAGLDQDYTGKPWEPMPQLLAVAEYITKTHAICMKCGQPANYSQRTFESEERVAVGATGMYEARCRQCFVPHADAPTVHPD